MLDPEWSRRGFLGLGVSAGFLPARLMASTAMEWSNGVLVLPDGSTTTGGLRVRDGIIESVGPSVTGGIDLDGAWIVPGFTDAGCRLGLVEVGMEADTHDSSTKENQAPDARAVDGYNPRSELIPVARVNGITSILLNPESTGMIPGQAALMRTVGDRLGDVVLAAPAGLCMNVGRAAQAHDGPKSRIGVMQKWRHFFEEHAKGDRKRKKKGDKGKGGVKEIAGQLCSGELLALVRANRADDIERAIDLIAEQKLRAALVGCIEGHLVADRIADAGLPVILGPLDAQPGSFQHPHARYDNAALLHKAGVRLSFRSGDAHQVRNLPTLAGLAVAHGLPWGEAIRALTINPMDLFGQPNLGRLAVGAEATFFVVAGDPLQPRHPVREVYIRGVSTSMETRHTRLYEQYKELW